MSKQLTHLALGYLCLNAVTGTHHGSWAATLAVAGLLNILYVVGLIIEAWGE